MFFEYFGLFKGQKPHRNTRRTTVTRSKAAVSEAARSPTAAPPLNAFATVSKAYFVKTVQQHCRLAQPSGTQPIAHSGGAGCKTGRFVGPNGAFCRSEQPVRCSKTPASAPPTAICKDFIPSSPLTARRDIPAKQNDARAAKIEKKIQIHTFSMAFLAGTTFFSYLCIQYNPRPDRQASLLPRPQGAARQNKQAKKT